MIQKLKIAVLLLLGVVATYSLFVDRKYYYSLKHLRQTAEKVECKSFPCYADFDGDSIVERVTTHRNNRDNNEDLSLVVENDQSRLLEVPYLNLDSTLHTPVAIVADGNSPRLLVFDGKKMSQIPVSNSDQAIFDAMALNDDGGTRNEWLPFVALRLLVYFGVAVTVLGMLGFHVIKLLRLRS